MKLMERISSRINDSVKVNRARDAVGVLKVKLRRNPWPCLDKKYLVVGCESSGTTPISHLLLQNGSTRFLFDGSNPWIWDLYMSVYQGLSRVRDYPQLQLYDSLKVPGFAAILGQYVEEFPNASVVYVVRDPRDVVLSAYKSTGATTRDELASIRWVKETWLGITSKDPVARLAFRWKTYLEKSRLAAGVTYVRYEDFCADKVGCIKSLASKLGLPCDEEHVCRFADRQASTSDWRNYDPQGPGGWQSDGRLSNGDVGIIEDICGTHMEKWMYT